MQKNEISQRIEHFLQILKLLNKETKISELSGGQQKLVSMAVSMIYKPPLLMLDEPTVGVDSPLRSKLWNYLNNLFKDEGNISERKYKKKCLTFISFLFRVHLRFAFIKNLNKI
jgi:ABC-type multidrug transport system ATPase subunit